MSSLSELLDQAGSDNPLRPYVEAILDAGLVVTLRDGAGDFASPSSTFASALGHVGGERVALGRAFVDGQRFFDEHGHELTRTEHPAQVARRTGIPQRQRVLGVRATNGEEVWLLASFMPVRPTPSGWEVLAVSSILRRSVFRPPTEAADDLLTGADDLLSFALAVSGRRLDPRDLAHRLKEPIRALVPAPASVSLMLRRDRTLYPQPITRYGNHPVVETVGMSDDAVARWDRNATCYVPDLQPTDIVGDRVVVEYDDPIRSFALVPIWEGAQRVASFVVASPEPRALSPQQIASLEALGRLAGPALDTGCP